MASDENRWTADEHRQIREEAERRAAELPRRQPGAHWTGPSGEHIEVPITPRTLTNIRQWGRAIT